MKVRSLPGARFGAVVEGVDLSEPQDAATQTALDRALAENYILCFPGQSLEPDQVVDASRIFGPVEPHVTPGYYHPDTDLLLVLTNQVNTAGQPLGIKDAGTFWHSDVSYRERPAKATLLYSIEAPDEGGDTLFCDMVAALEALPADLRYKLDGREAVHHYAQRDKIAAAQGTTQVVNGQTQNNTPPVNHPTIRTHPLTGRTSLYVNPAYTVEIEGLATEDSADTLARIYDHCLQDRFRLRFKWRPGDVVVWENISVMHSATTHEQPPTQPRTLWRTVITSYVTD